MRASAKRSILAAALLSLVSGCADLCSPGVKTAAKPVSSASAHRSHAFPDDGADDLPMGQGAPQNVNVFGEVNGARRHNSAALLAAKVGLQQHTFTDEGYDSDVAVDPAGKWLAFASTRNSEHPSIYLQRVDGAAVTQITSDGSDDDYPAFSPDGKQIAFSSTRTGSWQVFLMDVDGRNVTQVTSGAAQAIHPSFSPDATRLAYCSLGSRSGQWELWVVSLKTGEKRMVGYGLFPTWSPDKNVDRIAFQRPRQRGSRWFSLWTLDLVNGEARRVTEVAVSANAAILTPTWSPDGRKLAFTTVLQPAHGAGNKPRGQTDIWTVESDGSNRQRLTDGRGTNLTPCWAADGRVYFISDRSGNECVWSVRPDSDKDRPAVAQENKQEPAAPKETADLRSPDQ